MEAVNICSFTIQHLPFRDQINSDPLDVLSDAGEFLVSLDKQQHVGRLLKCLLTLLDLSFLICPALVGNITFKYHSALSRKSLTKVRQLLQC